MWFFLIRSVPYRFFLDTCCKQMDSARFLKIFEIPVKSMLIQFNLCFKFLHMIFSRLSKDLACTDL